jgi:hypothetical protein
MLGLFLPRCRRSQMQPHAPIVKSDYVAAIANGGGYRIACDHRGASLCDALVSPLLRPPPLALLKPCRDEALKIWPVGKAVGNIKNNGPELAMAG